MADCVSVTMTTSYYVEPLLLLRRCILLYHHTPTIPCCGLVLRLAGCCSVLLDHLTLEAVSSLYWSMSMSHCLGSAMLCLVVLLLRQLDAFVFCSKSY